MIDDTDDDLGAQTVSNRECEHGGLARNCEICELLAENAELMKDRAEVLRGNGVLQVKLAEAKAELSTLRESVRRLRAYEAHYGIFSEAAVTSILDRIHKPEDSSDD